MHLINGIIGFIDADISSGIRIAGTDIWLDPKRKKPLAFISHAHSDHLSFSHSAAITSLRTAAMIKPFFKGNIRAINWEERIRVGNATVELFPAGHILGSSQIMIEVNGLRFVYTGDIKLSESFTSERIKIKKCDILIMECTYGNPKFIFPEREEVADQIIRFVKGCFARRITPIIVAYRIGKAQEVVKILGDAGIRTRLENSIYRITNLYKELGVRLSNFKPFPPFTPHREAIIIPPQKLYLVRPIHRKKIAVCTGWTLDKDMISRFYHDVAIPLSDHADFSELIRYVTLAKPKKVYTIHGDRKFADYLRQEGFDAVHLDKSFIQPTLWGYI